MSLTTPSSDAFPGLSLPVLESELLGLAGHIAAAECRFLQLLAEFDRRGGWCGVGIRSCAHWLTWRAGMSLRTATEHLRVARALENLPLVTAEFAAGRLSYSKVRAITRVTGADGAALTRAAAAAGVAAGGEAQPGVDAQPGGGAITVGTAVIGEETERGESTEPVESTVPVESTEPVESTVPGESTAIGDGASPCGATPTQRDTVDDGAGECRSGSAESVPSPRPEPTVADAETAERVMLELAMSSTASHVETVVRAVRRRTTPPVDTAARRSLSWHHDVDGSLVLRGRFTPEDGAELIAAIEALVPPPTPAGTSPAGRSADLLDQGREQEPGPTVDRTAARRADALLELVRHGDGPGATGPVVTRGSAQVVVHMDVGSGSARLAGGPEIPTTTAERLACDARVQVLLGDRATNRLYLGRSRRLASPAQIAALTARDAADGGGCRFPGCDHTRHLHAHHVRSWLSGGATDIDNLVLLCSYHHRLVHDAGYRIRYRADAWDFRRPDGTPVSPLGPPLSGAAAAIVEINTRADLQIDRVSLAPDWYGDAVDPGPILDALLPPRTAATAA